MFNIGRKFCVVTTMAFVLNLNLNFAHADTVYCVNCSNEAMEMVRQAQNFAQYTQQTSNLIAQLEVARQQAARLTSSTPFSQSSALLANIMSLVNKGQALGYDLSNISQKFETNYPGFGKQQGSFYENYKRWSETASDSIRGALMSSGYQMGNFANETATAETLRQMNMSATGQMQAIQIGNAVSSEMLDEMRKLRQLNTAQMQAQNAYLLGEQEKTGSELSGLKSFLDQQNTVLPSDDQIRKKLKGTKQ
ncbi:P-type conjugative transfer protein TrbJ [Methylovorus glucosotrophus]|uniref:P-type conjugative transfer protein TrbJ n=1 Tax=Methylovorus glucosotrophus (strain SIP3-4) TaxID=582744 RepID=C6XES1_METGS|nr:P-type conjugative transfer protein TrbJ [Methylovorus glucosotrophus]ACT52128.1 P-type conjugative transfer protein TrbJ [Methylovorus glucosotrophus SIP3-4]